MLTKLDTINDDGLLVLMKLIHDEFEKYQKARDGKGLSTNDFTNELRYKLQSIELDKYYTKEEVDKLIPETGGSEVLYSTEEHRVGTWLDGSTLYEKTFMFDLPNAFDGAYFGPVKVEDAKFGLIYDAFSYWEDGTNVRIGSNNYMEQYSCNITAFNITTGRMYLRKGVGFPSPCVITVRYCKNEEVENG